MQKPRAQDLAESLKHDPGDDFLASIAHDLRTPLNAIGGYAELIEMGIGGAVSLQQREYLERIRTAQQDLLALISDLLSYSRIETR